MQRPGTEAIRTQIQPPKPKGGILKLQMRTYGHPSEQLFSKRWPLSNPNRTKNNMNTRKVKQRKKGNREPQQDYRLGKVSNELLWEGLIMAKNLTSKPSLSKNKKKKNNVYPWKPKPGRPGISICHTTRCIC